MIVRDVGIRCDLCDVMAPPAAEILRAHGLRRLGWHTDNRGAHVCPAHPHPERPA